MSRFAEAVLAALLLLLAAPLLLAIAVAIAIGSGRPLCVVQRPGRFGVPFGMIKFRTLEGDGAGPSVAVAGDPRTTRLGHWLRRWRLDELPQLWNVCAGQMALVGPRPEVPANLAEVPAADQAVLWQQRPGLTGPTQLAFLAEDEVLAGVADPVSVYRRVIVPAKVGNDLRLAGSRTWWRDLGVLLQTPFALASRRMASASRDRVSALLRSAGVIPCP